MYAQYENGNFRELVGNIVFSDTVYQTAESLTDEQRAQFNVYNIVDVMPDPPSNCVWSESWTYQVDGANIIRIWSHRPKTAEELEAERKALIPASVSPRQIRQALTRFNVRTQVEAAVAAGDQDLKDWWEFATVVERNHPMVVGMATALGISEQELDAIFLAAGAL